MHIIQVGLSAASVDTVQSLVKERTGFVPLDVGLPEAEVQALSRRVEEATTQNPDGVVLGCGPEELACVLFTSGSTGRPKGVVYDWSLVEWLVADGLEQLARGDAGAKTAMFSSPAYNAGFLRAILPLAGPQVVPINPAVTPPQEILRILREEGVNQVSFVPALIDALYDAVHTSGGRLTQVHTAYVFGEKVSWDRIARAREIIHPDALIVVRYATTEAPGGVLNYEIPAGMPLGEGLVPLGVPTTPGRVKVEPIGEGSEYHQIAVREPLARGYLDDDELTATRFVTDGEGVRWWLSGDLAHVDANGVFHFLGRRDDVVKINGRLVDPAVSEKALAGIDGIARVIVLPHDALGDDPHLVAHLVLEDGATLTSNQVYHALFEQVAFHHVPRTLVRHDALPLGARGKVDRVALQSTVWPRWSSRTGHNVSARTGGLVLRLLRELLENPDLDYGEDTWGAGMDSLAASEFVTRIEQLGYGSFPPTLLLERRSAKSLTDYFETSPKFVARNTVVLNAEGSMPPLVCIPGAGATALSFQAFAAELGSDYPVVVVEPRGMHAEGEIDRSLEALARSAIVDAAAFLGEKDVRLVGHSAGGQIAFEMADQLQRKGYSPRVVFLDSTQLFLHARPSVFSWWWKKAALRVQAVWLFIQRQLLKRFAPEALVPGSEATVSQVGRSQPTYRDIRRIIEHAAGVYRTKPVSFPMLLLRCGPDSRPHITSTYTTLQQMEVAGEHRTILQQPFVGAIAEATKEFLLTERSLTP